MKPRRRFRSAGRAFARCRSPHNSAAMKPLSPSDRQSRLVQDAAKAVPISKLDEFLQQLARHLGAEPSDAAVLASLNAQLDRLTHNFMCDSQFWATK
jgi:hypothetical protein